MIDLAAHSQYTSISHLSTPASKNRSLSHNLRQIHNSFPASTYNESSQLQQNVQKLFRKIYTSKIPSYKLYPASGNKH